MAGGFRADDRLFRLRLATLYGKSQRQAGHPGFLLEGRDIRINVLSPGHINTPGLSELMRDEQKAEAVSHVPLGRLGTPDDMGKAAVFLASDDSAYVNGIELFADGGVAQY